MTQPLQKFREALYAHFPKRADAVMNLLDALTAHGKQAKSVVQLSESSAFERHYSSITDAIGLGLTQADWGNIQSLIHQTTQSVSPHLPYCFIVDCTPQPRPYAKTLEDRHITHSPNPAPSNKPICVGHQYTVLARCSQDAREQEAHWLVPYSAKRVPSDQKGNEIGMQQIVDQIEALALTDELTVSVGDSLYSTQACRMTAYQQKNLVHITRLNSKRNVFLPPQATCPTRPSGRQKEFGRKMNLSLPQTHPASDDCTTLTWVSQSGKRYTAILDRWKNCLLRGSRTFRSSRHPIHVLRVVIKQEAGNAVFKRPLWIAVMGQRRDEITLEQVYQHYRSRYDIEHLFRFGKQGLLMDAYQTPELSHEEAWWKLCLLAYVQLYLAKEDITCLPKPWERYLPAYRTPSANPPRILTPSQVQRGFPDLLAVIGTPAKPCVPRGRPAGRVLGDTPTLREKKPLVFKTRAKKIPPKKTKAPADESHFSGSALRVQKPNPQTMDELIQWVRDSLEPLGVSLPEFSGKLLNST